jgi:hypothetical protein
MLGWSITRVGGGSLRTRAPRVGFLAQWCAALWLVGSRVRLVYGPPFTAATCWESDPASGVRSTKSATQRMRHLFVLSTPA